MMKLSRNVLPVLLVLLEHLFNKNVVLGQGCSNTCPPINFGTPVPSLCVGDDFASSDSTSNNKMYETCHPTPTTKFRFADYMIPGQIVVISNFYIGCNAGRRESGVFAHVAQKYYNEYGNRTMFITSLKGGTSCSRWATMYQNDATRLFPNQPEVIPKEMPLTVYDQEYELRDELFTTPFGHPSYVILEGTELTVRHKFIGPCCGYESYYDCTPDIAKQLDTTISQHLDKILAETEDQWKGGKTSPFSNFGKQEQEDNEEPCQVGDFSDWSECSVTCGEGVQFRHRLVIGDSSEEGSCSLSEFPLVETRSCNTGIDCAEKLKLDSTGTCISEFGETWEIETVSSDFDGPRDVAFHPTPGLHLGNYSEGRPFHPDVGEEEAWVVNGNNHSVSIVTSMGTSKQSTISRRDRGYYHYMVNATALSFNMVSNTNRSADRDGYNYWAVCNDNLNTYMGYKEANNFMGPTLYNSNPNNNNLVTRSGEPCGGNETNAEPCFFLHADMLHESPGCIGIVHDPETITAYGNIYWAFDATGNGTTGQLVRFDFQQPHGPGSMDHSVAAVRRYPEVVLQRGNVGVHAGMVVHDKRRELYIAVPGANQIIVVNMDSGSYARTAREEYPIFSSRLPSFEYSIWECIEQRVFVTDIGTPTGLAINEDGDKLFVAERDTGKIHVYEIPTGILLFTISTNYYTIGGMTFSPKKQVLYFVDDETNTLNAIKPSTECKNPIPTTSLVPPLFNMRVQVALMEYYQAGLSPNIIPNEFSLLYHDYKCDVDPVVPDTVFFDQVHLDTGYASDNPDVQSAVAGMDASAALLANRTDCDPTSELNFDALLLGGYYCHQCLPYGGAMCDTGGTCTNVQWRGYTCDNEYTIQLEEQHEQKGMNVTMQKSDGTVIVNSSITTTTKSPSSSSSESLLFKEDVTYRFTVRGNIEVCAHAVPSNDDNNMMREGVGGDYDISLSTTALSRTSLSTSSQLIACGRNGPLLLTGGPKLPERIALHAYLQQQNDDDIILPLMTDIRVEGGTPFVIADPTDDQGTSNVVNNNQQSTPDKGATEPMTVQEEEDQESGGNDDSKPTIVGSSSSPSSLNCRIAILSKVLTAFLAITAVLT